MKFPYGISDFDSLITRKFHYVDRTDHIPLLEKACDQLLFLRPRRLGKSLLLSMLENFYCSSRLFRAIGCSKVSPGTPCASSALWVKRFVCRAGAGRSQGRPCYIQ
uniref:Predicted AAA-ATPase n=1 Tax=Candidatus Kentrum sp. FW TaxID=2126338 RepID=A0A450T413_9GAMM|nr:MAG: Predicted AAA-ATPase [Candidatus Kentron sp. FW]